MWRATLQHLALLLRRTRRRGQAACWRASRATGALAATGEGGGSGDGGDGGGIDGGDVGSAPAGEEMADDASEEMASDLEQLRDALDERGVSELALKAKLLEHWPHLANILLKRPRPAACASAPGAAGGRRRGGGARSGGP